MEKVQEVEKAVEKVQDPQDQPLALQEHQEEELQEALRRSRWSQEQEAQETHGFTPTAPPMEEEEGELVPDLVGVRPPLYAQEVAPPPPGQAYRISQTEDEVRRRRLERFS